MERVYIGLGSNLAEPQKQLRTALLALDNIPATQLAAVSPSIPATRWAPRTSRAM